MNAALVVALFGCADLSGGGELLVEDADPARAAAQAFLLVRSEEVPP